jgi:dihydroneopterin aldolase
MSYPHERILSVKGLSVTSRIGVPDEERAASQRLLLDLRFAGVLQPSELGDEIGSTVDYHAVALRAAMIAGSGERRLIETLAEDLASDLISRFDLRWIEITVRKFILPDAEWVSVEIRREA